MSDETPSPLEQYFAGAVTMTEVSMWEARALRAEALAGELAGALEPFAHARKHSGSTLRVAYFDAAVSALASYRAAKEAKDD